ncbi:MAG: hypothetical protein JXB05_26960 [Myxococcaceae bacterium]|nr:hypothetical protein [Myxococcaceae bacterium]
MGKSLHLTDGHLALAVDLHSLDLPCPDEIDQGGVPIYAQAPGRLPLAQQPHIRVKTATPGAIIALLREQAGDGGEGCLDLPELFADALGAREQGAAS